MNKKNVVFAVAFTIALSGLFFTGCSKTTEPASVLLNKAISNGENAKWKQALALIEKAEKQNPKNADIQLFHVLALENNGKMEEALFRIRQLANDNTNSFEVQYTLGRLYFASGEYEQALVPLQNALNARQQDSNTLLLLAKTCMRLKKYKQSLYYYKLLTINKEFANQPEIYNEIGVLYALTGDTNKAISLFQAKGSKFPVSVLNHAIIRDYYLRGNRDDAIKLYNNYLRMTAKNPELEQERLHVTQRLKEIR